LNECAYNDLIIEEKRYFKGEMQRKVLFPVGVILETWHLRKASYIFAKHSAFT